MKPDNWVDQAIGVIVIIVGGAFAAACVALAYGLWCQVLSNVSRLAS